MNCRICNHPISHTFGSFFLSREVHASCETFMTSQENIVAYPFLEGVIIVDYLVDHLDESADKDYLIMNYMSRSIHRAINENAVIVFLDEHIHQDALYLLFLLSNQRLYWVFLERPSFIE